MGERDTHPCETSADAYDCLDLFRRALRDEAQDAWAALHHAYYRLVLGWVKKHPAARIVELREPLESYAHEVFERLLIANRRHRLDVTSLGAILTYMHTCVNWVMLDAVRATRREISLEVVYEVARDDDADRILSDLARDELWDIVRQMASPRELRLAHALWVEGYRPREIPALLPDDFADIRAVRRAIANLIDRLRRRYRPHTA